jgi:FKBP-type peptidyl-prolyl cis-trans isomerase (trigger factor)
MHKRRRAQAALLKIENIPIPPAYVQAEHETILLRGESKLHPISVFPNQR